MLSDEAEALAQMLLSVDQLESRFSGSTTLPQCVTTSTGKRESHLIHPGRDRIQVIGIPNNTSSVAGPTERIDSFRVKRLSVSVDNGAVRSQIEFDTGASLLDTLNARLETVQTLTSG